jgi:galactose mutarotase-like enzyme
MLCIENDRLKIVLDSKGAELKSIVHKQHGIEYLWGADPAYWAKTSPVLFPIVGTLKENTYKYNDHAFTLSRHGFARDKMFTVTNQQNDSITFSIESDEATLAVYPFHFIFSVIYTLNNDELTVAYLIQNRGRETMLFSVGGHPAFKVPLAEGTSYEDYKLVFEKEENAGRWPISKDGLIEKSSQLLLNGTNVLSLRKELFSEDALVLKGLQSSFVKLVSDKSQYGIRFSFPGFPYLGLWAAPGADFLCIEPWCGIADSVDSNQQLEHKEGILRLQPARTFNVQWQAQFY